MHDPLVSLHVWAGMYLCMYACMHVQCVYVCVRIYTYICVLRRVCMHACMQTGLCTRTSRQQPQTWHIPKTTRAFVHVLRLRVRVCIAGILSMLRAPHNTCYVCVRVYTYACMHVCMHVCVHMYAYMHGCMHVYVYACMHVCMCMLCRPLMHKTETAAKCIRQEHHARYRFEL